MSKLGSGVSSPMTIRPESRLSLIKFGGSKAHQSFFRDVAENILLCSYALWNCRHEPLWVECSNIKVEVVVWLVPHPLPVLFLFPVVPRFCSSTLPVALFLILFVFCFMSLSFFLFCMSFTLRPTRVLGFYVPALFSFE